MLTSRCQEGIRHLDQNVFCRVSEPGRIHVRFDGVLLRFHGRFSSNPERRLYAASWGHGAAQCSRRYHCVFRLGSGSLDGEHVPLEHSEEALTGCVITRVADSTHTTDQVVLVQTVLEVSTGKLGFAI